MTNPDYTHLTLIIDRSGSMASVKDDAQGAINTYLQEQRVIPAGRMTVSLVDFDQEVTTRDDLAPIEKVPDYVLRPRGMTALYDAVGIAITDTGSRLAALPEAERPGQVLVAIVTDGKDNRSQDWTADSVRELIARQAATYSWRFAFLGAEEAAWTGQHLGIAQTMSYASTGAGTRDAYSTLSRSTTDLRAGKGFSLPDPATPAHS